MADLLVGRSARPALVVPHLGRRESLNEICSRRSVQVFRKRKAEAPRIVDDAIAQREKGFHGSSGEWVQALPLEREVALRTHGHSADEPPAPLGRNRRRQRQLRQMAPQNTATPVMVGWHGRPDGGVRSKASEIGVSLKLTNQSPYVEKATEPRRDPPNVRCAWLLAAGTSRLCELAGMTFMSPQPAEHAQDALARRCSVC